jgi:hypothetical protein
MGWGYRNNKIKTGYNQLRYCLTILIFIPFAVKAQELSFSKHLPEDKFYHLLAGAYISTPVAFAVKKPLLWGIGAATVAGVVKEVYDSYQLNNRFDVVDAAFTIVSGAVCATIVHFIKKKFK